jgi:hypothetical protein
MRTRRERILATVSDAVAHLLYYDRKEDAELPVGAIDDAVRSGEITVDEIVGKFASELKENIES